MNNFGLNCTCLGAAMCVYSCVIHTCMSSWLLYYIYYIYITDKYNVRNVQYCILFCAHERISKTELVNW